MPPLVTVPTTSEAPCRMPRANPTTSLSSAATDVKVVGSSPLTGCIMRIAAAASSSSSASPES